MSHRIHAFLFGTALVLMLGAPAMAGNADWTRLPAKNYDVRSLRIDDLSATIAIDVKDGGPTQLDINGTTAMVKRTQVREAGRELFIKGNENGKVWDWHNWFDFRGNRRDNGKSLYVHLVVPRGLPIRIEGFSGAADIGNTNGPLSFKIAGKGDAKIGNVADADLSLSGGGKIVFGNAAKLHVGIAGGGKIRGGEVGETHVETAGSGAVTLAKVTGPLHVEISGSGDFSCGGANGPTHIEIAGSGAVKINDGVADPLHVEIMGSADVYFGGLAVNPHIESMGSGNVRLKAYRGELHNEGNSNLKIGQ